MKLFFVETNLRKQAEFEWQWISVKKMLDWEIEWENKAIRDKSWKYETETFIKDKNLYFAIPVSHLRFRSKASIKIIWTIKRSLLFLHDLWSSIIYFASSTILIIPSLMFHKTPFFFIAIVQWSRNLLQVSRIQPILPSTIYLL